MLIVRMSVVKIKVSRPIYLKKLQAIFSTNTFPKLLNYDTNN